MRLTPLACQIMPMLERLGRNVYLDTSDNDNMKVRIYRDGFGGNAVALELINYGSGNSFNKDKSTNVWRQVNFKFGNTPLFSKQNLSNQEVIEQLNHIMDRMSELKLSL